MSSSENVAASIRRFYPLRAADPDHGAAAPSVPGTMATVTAEPLGHVPALDGIRALAVAAVLAFHGGIPGTDGGFLGVSVFFTLSGFLITSLLLRQWVERGRIPLGEFWPRRFRRLLPASWFTLAAVVAAGALGVWQDDQLRDLRGDVPWSLAELVNWHFIASGESYGDTFSPPSPVEHFWSLAIEQQFYVVLPLLVALVLTARPSWAHRTRLRVLVGVLVVAGVASATANGVLGSDSVDRAYFGTDTRAAELLVGALLACALLPRLRAQHRGVRAAALVGGVAGLAVLGVLFHVARLDSTWMYPWGFLATAAATSAVIVGGLQAGPLAAGLASPPLTGLGRISYGVYLLHWPLFLWLTPQRLDWPTAPLFALRVAVTLAAAAAMYRLLERPVRLGSLVRTRTVRWALPLAAIAILGATWSVTRDLPPPPEYLQPRDETVEVREASPPSTTTPTTAPPTTAGPAPAPTQPPPPPTEPPVPPTRVLLVGDSVAASLEDELGDALTARGISFATATAPGCGVVTGDPAEPSGRAMSITTECGGAIPDIQGDAVRQVGPDLVLVMSSWESTDRIVDGTFYAFGTPEFEQALTALYDEALGRLTATGAAVAIAPLPETVDSDTGFYNQDTLDRQRWLSRFLREYEARAPTRTTLIPFDRMVCPATPCPTVVDGVRLRPLDGSHFDDPTGARWAADRLAAAVAALDLRTM